MSDWLFDLGNTRLKLAPLDPGGAGPVAAFGHGGEELDPAWSSTLPSRIDVAWLASVGPAALRASLLQVLVPRAARVVEVRVEREMAGVRIGYAEPARLGVDRALALVGARAREPGWVLVIGVGTALTVDLLAADGQHHGGSIAPSPTLMRETLHARAPQLPATGGDAMVFAIDTTDALAAGCLGAALGLVERSRREACARAGVPVGVLLHGGGAGDLLPHVPGALLAPSLVVDGLARLARQPAGTG
ncbi:type III pantothenate kinase [Luteimonas sp. A537]